MLRRGKRNKTVDTRPSSRGERLRHRQELQRSQRAGADAAGVLKAVEVVAACVVLAADEKAAGAVDHGSERADVGIGIGAEESAVQIGADSPQTVASRTPGMRRLWH